MSDRIECTAVSRNYRNTFSYDPADNAMWWLLGEDPDPNDIWHDGSDGTGAHSEQTLHGTTQHGNGTLADIGYAPYTTVSKATLHVRWKVVQSGNDAPVSLYFAFGANVYDTTDPDVVIDPAKTAVFHGYTDGVAIGATANSVLVLDSSCLYTAYINRTYADSPSQMAGMVNEFFGNAAERPGPVTIDFSTGTYGETIVEIYEAWIEVEPLDTNEPLAQVGFGILDTTRTIFTAPPV